MIEGELHLAREMPDAGLLRKFPARRLVETYRRLDDKSVTGSRRAGHDESAADLDGFRGALLVLPDLSGEPLFSPG